MKSSARLLGAVMIAAPTLFAHPLAAQFAQYTAPGQQLYDPETRQNALDRAIAEALWHFGRAALDPYLGISDLSYLQNRSSQSGEKVSEWTASATAGLRGYFPVGSKTTIAAFALPKYVWFEKNSDANRINQRFGAGIFTYFNRLAIEIKGQRIEDLGYVTTETSQRISSRSDAVTADLEVPVGSRISVVGGGALTKSRHDLDGDPLVEGDYTDLDNDSTSWRAGLRFYMTSTFSITGDYHESDTDFPDGARDRSNSGDGWGAGLAWRRPKTGASVSFRHSNLEPKEGSEFEGFQGDTWNGELSWSPRERLGLSLYSRRNLGYTLNAAESFFVDDRVGLRANLGIGWRFNLSLFSEQGNLDYGQGTTSTTDRKDDVTAWGATLSFPLGRRFNVRAGFRRTEVDSRVPGAGYRLDEIVGNFGFGGGGSGATWF